MNEKIEQVPVKYYLKTVPEVEQDLKTSLQVGLTPAEAELRLEKIGPNQLQEGRKRTIWQMFLDQFSDVLIIILLVSAAISVLLGEVTDAIIIGIIVILNATLSVVQEFKAEKSLDALKKMTVPEALVLRGGRQKKIKSTQLVPGDIVFLEAGERIPADLRLFEVTELGIQEAVLTGESEPVE